jgi:hypothetical protein
VPGTAIKAQRRAKLIGCQPPPAAAIVSLGLIGTAGGEGHGAGQ